MKKIGHLLAAAKTWQNMRGLQSRFASRDRFLQWQSKAVSSWIHNHAKQVDRFSQLPAGSSLEIFPIMEKADLMNDFSAYNIPRITAEEGWRAFGGTRMIGDWHVGASTGTSGNRGLFVVSDRERYLWLGAMLGKLLPSPWMKRERIAVILPLHTRLYDAANDTLLLKLRFFDVTQGAEAWIADLEALNPTTIIAPPRMLRWLAENAAPILNPDRIYSGAEVLDPIDTAVIESRWPARLGQIYMATEGVLGTTCPLGTLHLAEDLMHFEMEPAGGGLVTPIITDFRRTSQIMARYRMNDLLRLAATPCKCGSPLTAVTEIVGRQDDCFTFKRGQTEHIVTPDVMRNAVLDSDRRIVDFRILQIKEDVELHLSNKLPTEAVQRANEGLKRLFLARGIEPQIVTVQRELAPEKDRKLRRVKKSSHLS